VETAAGWNGHLGLHVRLLAWAVSEVAHEIVTTFPKWVSSVSVAHLKLNSVQLASAKSGPVGSRGVNARVKLAKSVEMGHDHVFAGALV